MTGWIVLFLLMQPCFELCCHVAACLCSLHQSIHFPLIADEGASLTELGKLLDKSNVLHQTSSSELPPRKIELMCAHSKKHDYPESLHITMKCVITPTETSLTTLIFSS